jgi:hypothetical protein
LLLTLVRFGANTFKQEFASLPPEKQEEVYEEWVAARALIKEKMQ